MLSDRAILISIKSDKASVRFDIRSSMKSGKEEEELLSPFPRTFWLKIRRKKISLKILIAREWESVDLRTSLIKYLVSYFYISSLQGFANSFFFLTSFCPFDVFENFSSSFLLFFGFIFWTGQIGDFLLPSFPLTKIIIIKLYVEFDTKYGKFLWMNKLTFRSNNISQNFVLLTLHEKLTFNIFVFVKNYLCTR